MFDKQIHVQKWFFPSNEVRQLPRVLKRSLLEKPGGFCKKRTARTTSSLLANSSSSSSLSPTPLSKKLKEDHCHVCEHPITHLQEAIQCDICGHIVHRWSCLHYDFKVCKDCYNSKDFTDDYWLDKADGAEGQHENQAHTKYRDRVFNHALNDPQRTNLEDFLNAEFTKMEAAGIQSSGRGTVRLARQWSTQMFHSSQSSQSQNHGSS